MPHRITTFQCVLSTRGRLAEWMRRKPNIVGSSRLLEGGDVIARHNLGSFEACDGTISRAVKHWMISAGAGHDDSSKAIRQGFLERHATKDNFGEGSTCSNYATVDEMKSDQRDTAEAVKRQQPLWCRQLFITLLRRIDCA